MAREALPRCRGYPVEFDPKLHYEVAVAVGVWRPKIKVSATFFSLALPFQAAVLMHEVGHLRLGHCGKRLAHCWLPLVNYRAAIRMARAQEIEADEYAAREGFGRALAMFYRGMQEGARAKGYCVPRGRRIMQPTTDYRCRRIMLAARGA